MSRWIWWAEFGGLNGNGLYYLNERGQPPLRSDQPTDWIIRDVQKNSIEKQKASHIDSAYRFVDWVMA